MKKTNTKLQLKTNTIRMLQTSELEQVNGGRITFGCSGQYTTCLAEAASHAGNHNDGANGN
jgi:hypothetical protein